MNRGSNTKVTIRASLNQSMPETSSHCRYAHRDCVLSCVEGYDYCIRHILEDKTAPYRPCAYITKSGRKCPSAAPKLEKKDGLCAFHTKKGLLTRQRLAKKRRPKETSDSLLEDLVSNTSSMESNNHSTDHKRSKASNDSIASRSIDYASSSDSETENLLLEQAWRDSGDSDADSVDSDQEDALKHAGVYVSEEAAMILRDKLIRLQALYIDQFKRLRHIFLTKREKYLPDQKIEKELYGSMSRYKQDPSQRELYEKLCAMKRYHKKFGIEALMGQQSKRRRMKATEGMEHKVPIPIKCSFVDEGLQCTHTVVPLSKFCQKHILHDQNQVLYQPCPFADSQCGRPVPTLLGSPFCSLHQALLPSISPAIVNPGEVIKEENHDEEENKYNARRAGLELKPDPSVLNLNAIRDHVKRESTSSIGRDGGQGMISIKEEIEEFQCPDKREEIVSGLNNTDMVDSVDEDEDDDHGLR